jgi:hypothetical protein
VRVIRGGGREIRKGGGRGAGRAAIATDDVHRESVPTTQTRQQQGLHASSPNLMQYTFYTWGGGMGPQGARGSGP